MTCPLAVLLPVSRYGTEGVGEGEYDANRAARGYDWSVLVAA